MIKASHARQNLFDLLAHQKEQNQIQATESKQGGGEERFRQGFVAFPDFTGCFPHPGAGRAQLALVFALADESTQDVTRMIAPVHITWAEKEKVVTPSEALKSIAVAPPSFARVGSMKTPQVENFTWPSRQPKATKTFLSSSAPLQEGIQELLWPISLAYKN